jgi:hypothetical protein
LVSSAWGIGTLLLLFSLLVLLLVLLPIFLLLWFRVLNFLIYEWWKTLHVFQSFV